MKLYNTPTRAIEEFRPIKDGEVLVYTCGPTVYSKQHIGNYASYIYWDTLVRVLQLSGYKVKRVLNLTDVGHLVSDADDGEDKMEKGARAEGKTAWQVADEWGNDFLKNLELFNTITPSKVAKATDYIDADLELIQTLKDKGYTYQINDGIYYDTSKFPAYADFAHLDVEALKAGARVEHNPEKRNITDFALWKFTPKGAKRDMEWETPSELLESDEPRMGFPGWHLECSTIIKQELGETIDIHTGGVEHIPVHHTNEIAQSEAANGAPLSNYWLHAHWITADGQKISKSLDNGFTPDDLLEKGFTHTDYRMWILQGQFTSDRDFSFDGLEAARNRLLRWQNIAALRWQTQDTLAKDSDKKVDLYVLPKVLLEAVSDNLNTPQAFALVDQAFTKLEDEDLSEINGRSLLDLLEFMDEIFGLNLIKSTPDITDEIKQKIVQRNRARDARDWAKADELRDEIEQAGITLKDVSSGSVWQYK